MIDELAGTHFDMDHLAECEEYPAPAPMPGLVFERIGPASIQKPHLRPSRHIGVPQFKAEDDEPRP